jgi:hypothetical protein
MDEYELEQYKQKLNNCSDFEIRLNVKGMEKRGRISNVRTKKDEDRGIFRGFKPNSIFVMTEEGEFGCEDIIMDWLRELKREGHLKDYLHQRNLA